MIKWVYCYYYYYIIINVKELQFIQNVNGDIVSYTSKTAKIKKVILIPSKT